MGKTRLALELALRLEKAGWEARRRRRCRSVPRNRRFLAIIDYAETRRPDIVALLSAALSRDAPEDKPIRVILLAREAGDWWRELKSADGGVGALLAGEQAYSVGPLASTRKDRETCVSGGFNRIFCYDRTSGLRWEAK